MSVSNYGALVGDYFEAFCWGQNQRPFFRSVGYFRETTYTEGMIMNFRRLSGIFCALVLISTFIGCGGSKTTDLTPSSGKETTASMPDWYLNPPIDPNYFFSVATALSRDLQVASNKAKTAARADLAQQLGTKMSELTENFQEEVGEGGNSELLQQFTSATKSVTNLTLNGSRLDQQEIIPERGVFRAYVLMSVPIGDANRQLMKEIGENKNLFTRFRATEAFAELKAEIKE